MNKIILVLAGILVVGLVGIFFYLNSTKSDENTPSIVESNALNPQSEKVEGYSGNVLAGSSSPFLEFENSDYEKAKNEGKIILLDFYADWCPICRAEEPEIFAGFNSLNSDQIVGFRVNFKDSSTDADEQALARELNIPYQHTKVILKNGQEVSRFTNQWTEQDFLNAVNSALK